jgi:hypothetical protein
VSDIEFNVMWTAVQIAARDGVSKQAVSKTVRKLLEDRPDTPAERGDRGQILSVSLAHYDEYRQRFVNPAKAAAPIRSGGGGQRPSAGGDLGATFEEARRQAEWLKVGRERIKHQEEIGQLIRKDELVAANLHIAREIQSVVARLQNHADDIAIAVSREGAHGARVALRAIAFELGNSIADRLGAIAAEAPEFDPLIETDENPENFT